MPLILKVWSNNPFNNGGCDFAIVELTRELANVALRRIASLCDQKRRDPSVYETYYWGAETEYFNPWSEQLGAPEEPNTCADAEERIEALQVNEREVVLTEEFAIVENRLAAVECGQMIVRESGVAFTAIPKHTDFYVTTAEIPKAVLQQALSPAKN